MSDRITDPLAMLGLDVLDALEDAQDAREELREAERANDGREWGDRAWAAKNREATARESFTEDLNRLVSAIRAAAKPEADA